MFNFEGRQNLGWLAALCCPSAPRLIMLLVFAALLMLAVPAAHAAGCTGFQYFPDWDSCDAHGDCFNFPDPFYVMVPASNFLTGDHTIYLDETCENVVPPDKNDYYDGSYYRFSYSASEIPGVAFGRSGRKAMEFCELNTDVEIAYVRKILDGLTMYYCEAGKRLGPERQRRQLLFVFRFKGNAKQALKECRKLAKSKPNHYPRLPNLVEPTSYAKEHWKCWRAWEVGDAYLQRVGA